MWSSTFGDRADSKSTDNLQPLYGLIEAKLELITHAYFDEGDFRQVSLLQETYKNLNSSLNPDLVRSSQVFLGESNGFLNEIWYCELTLDGATYSAVGASHTEGLT